LKAGAVASLQIVEEISRGSRSRQQKCKFDGSVAKPEIDQRIFAIARVHGATEIHSNDAAIAVLNLARRIASGLAGPPISQREKGKSY
jgi:hypothetical protein